MYQALTYTRYTEVTDLSQLKGLSGVYVLHFVDSKGNTCRFKHAAHYSGWALDLEKRITQHLKGQGANLTSVIKDAGLTFKVACVYIDADRTFERSLKTSGGMARRCPICKKEHN